MGKERMVDELVAVVKAMEKVGMANLGDDNGWLGRQSQQ